jgi:hypothetical protein
MLRLLNFSPKSNNQSQSEGGKHGLLHLPLEIYLQAAPAATGSHAQVLWSRNSNAAEQSFHSARAKQGQQLAAWNSRTRRAEGEREESSAGLHTAERKSMLAPPGPDGAPLGGSSGVHRCLRWPADQKRKREIERIQHCCSEPSSCTPVGLRTTPEGTWLLRPLGQKHSTQSTTENETEGERDRAGSAPLW